MVRLLFRLIVMGTRCRGFKRLLTRVARYYEFSYRSLILGYIYFRHLVAYFFDLVSTPFYVVRKDCTIPYVSCRSSRAFNGAEHHLCAHTNRK